MNAIYEVAQKIKMSQKQKDLLVGKLMATATMILWVGFIIGGAVLAARGL